MLNFEALPKAKPNGGNSTVEPGKYLAKVFSAKMMTSKTSGNEYLNVSFKLDKGGFVNENYFDSDKPFLLYKLGQLLTACNVHLEGEGTLKDVAKVIVGSSVLIDVTVNDRGYGSIDYSGDLEGVAPVEAEAKVETTLDTDIADALGIDPDEEF